MVFILLPWQLLSFFIRFWSAFSIRWTVKPTFKEPKKRELFCPIPFHSIKFKILRLRGISSSIRSSFHTSLNQSSSSSYTSNLTKMGNLFYLLPIYKFLICDFIFEFRCICLSIIGLSGWFIDLLLSIFCNQLLVIVSFLGFLFGITENCSYLYAFLWFVRNCWCLLTFELFRKLQSLWLSWFPMPLIYCSRS